MRDVKSSFGDALQVLDNQLETVSKKLGYRRLGVQDMDVVSSVTWERSSQPQD